MLSIQTQMVAMRLLVYSRIALAAACFHVASTASITAQDLPRPELNGHVWAGTAQELANVIRSLDKDSLGRDDVVGQLVLLLNDVRTVRQHVFGVESVRDVAWYKLLDLQGSSVPSIVRRVPQLESDRARGLAFEVIARIGSTDDQAYSQLLSYCDADDVYVRSRAISALSAVADESTTTINRFGELLDDPDPMVRWTVLDALEKRHDRIGRLVPAIIDLLDDESDIYTTAMFRPEELRGRAARLLAKVGADASDALPKLKGLTGPEVDTNVRIWAATAVCMISDTPTPDALGILGDLLLAGLDNEHAYNDAPEAITVLGRQAASLLDQLERAKTHRSPEVRWGIVDAFFAVDPASAISRVLPMTDDSNELVAQTAIEAISARRASEPAVIDAYIRALDSHDDIFEQPASSAVDALAKLGADARRAIPALEQLGRDSGISDTLREDVTRALNRIR